MKGDDIIMANFNSWQEADHAVIFDGRMFYPTFGLKQVYQNFNEFVLLHQCLPSDKPFTLVDIGCATGEISRYLRWAYPQMDYIGCDISKTALGRARTKYPKVKFIDIDIDLSVLKEIAPEYIFSRDVVIHQKNPFEFLRRLCSSVRQGVILRLRTRDKGQTVLDVENSCQLIYGHWAPFIIFNIDELVDFLISLKRCSKIKILKNYIPLGGFNARYLPKDCYLEETGTAESAVYIEISKEAGQPEVCIESRQEEVSIPIFCRVFSRILRNTVGRKDSWVWW